MRHEPTCTTVALVLLVLALAIGSAGCLVHTSDGDYTCLAEPHAVLGGNVLAMHCTRVGL